MLRLVHVGSKYKLNELQHHSTTTRRSRSKRQVIPEVQNWNYKTARINRIKQILENERYLAIIEGNLPIIISITSLLTEINEYMEKKGISKFANIQFNNIR